MSAARDAHAPSHDRAATGPRRIGATRPAGLDLGTSRVRAAAFVDGAPTALDEGAGPSGFPAMACFHGGVTRVGRAALGYGEGHARDTIVDVVRALGRSVEPPPPRSGPFERVRPAASAAHGPDEVASLLLRSATMGLGLRFDADPQPAVLAAPAWLDASGRAALLAAARRAELPFPVLVTNVVARALVLASTANAETRVALVDVGAGGVSAAIVGVGWRRVDVLGVAGDGSFGGVDVDAAIAEAVIARLPREAARAAAGPELAIALRGLAERINRDLSVTSSVEALVPFLRDARGEPVVVSVDRAAMDPAIETLAGHVERVVAEALRHALLPASAVRVVHATGGMARVAAVRQAIERALSRRATLGHLGPESVACGAALRAAMLDGAVDLVLEEADPRVRPSSVPPTGRVQTLPRGLLEHAARRAIEGARRATPMPRRPTDTAFPAPKPPPEPLSFTDAEIDAALAWMAPRASSAPPRLG